VFVVLSKVTVRVSPSALKLGLEAVTFPVGPVNVKFAEVRLVTVVVDTEKTIRYIVTSPEEFAAMLIDKSSF
jgi:hypothetical protein